MGLLDNQTQAQYYNSSNSGNYGNYQFTSLENIINAFMYIYVGEGKIISKANRTDVQFHAMRAVQELSYDVLKSFKSQEIEVPNTLSMVLPHDYVNYIKLVRVGTDGIERRLYPSSKTSDPFAIQQNDAGEYKFSDTDNADGDDDILTGGDILTEQVPSNTSSSFQDQEPVNYNLYDINYSSDVEISVEGRRYGLEPSHAFYR